MAVRVNENHKQSVSLRSFLKLYLPTLLLVLLIGGVTLWALAAAAERRLLAEQQSLLVLQRQVYAGYLETVVSDLVLLASDQRARVAIADSTPEDLQELSDLLRIFVNSRRSIDRIHVADAAGEVLLSIVDNRGRAELVAPDDAVSAATRLQIEEVRDSSRVRLSSIGLPTTFPGAARRGLFPVLRAAAPISSDNGARDGVIVIELVTDELSHRIHRLHSAAESIPLLLDRSGVSMIEPAGLPEDGDTHAAELYPRAWPAISGQQRGTFRGGEGVFVFDTFYPETIANSQYRLRLPAAAEGPVATQPVPARSGLQWKMVAMVPGARLRELNRTRLMIAAGIVGLLQFVQAGVVVAILRAYSSRRRPVESLRMQLSDVQERHAELETINDMGDLLQAATSESEMLQIVQTHALRLFPESCGALFLYHSPESVLERKLWWGDRGEPPLWLGRDDCWAVRRGKYHFVGDPETETGCSHYFENVPMNLCLPMMLRGEMIGVLHVAWQQPRPPGEQGGARHNLETARRVATSVAARLSLSLVNLRLRESLHAQSIRDALTGVHNRRYLDEILTRELLRSQRASTPISLLMFDVDHFKEFNDTHGHEAGDRLLQEVGAILRRLFRAEDVPCRYGGEEFVVLLPGADAAAAFARAEQLRKAVEESSVVHRGQTLAVTISIGIATIPDHADSAEDATAAADKALYQSKKDGRNRVTLFAPK